MCIYRLPFAGLSATAGSNTAVSIVCKLSALEKMLVEFRVTELLVDFRSGEGILPFREFHAFPDAGIAFRLKLHSNSISLQTVFEIAP